MSATGGALYELRGVVRTFKRGSHEIRAVDGVDLQVASGEFLAIEGQSGSGKSTMLQLLGALDRPSGGSLFFEGRDLGTLGDKELTALRAQHIGFVFQTFNLIPTMSALENVEAAMAATGKVNRSLATSLLERVGLRERATHLPSKLSGGEQQRVAIARALANDPRVVLADEPTGNLDSRTSDEVIELLSGLQRDFGMTIILVTHSEHVAARARRRVEMKDGRLLGEPQAEPSRPVFAI